MSNRNHHVTPAEADLLRNLTGQAPGGGGLNLSNLAARSVVGRSQATAGVPGAITAGTNHHVLRRDGETLGFGLLNGNNLVENIALRGNSPTRATAPPNTSNDLSIATTAFVNMMVGNTPDHVNNPNSGNWNPTMPGIDFNATGASIAARSFTRIGRICFICFDFNIGGNSMTPDQGDSIILTPTQNARIDGLPFRANHRQTFRLSFYHGALWEGVNLASAAHHHNIDGGARRFPRVLVDVGLDIATNGTSIGLICDSQWGVAIQNVTNSMFIANNTGTRMFGAFTYVIASGQ